MDEALKRCVFASKFEGVEQGADEHASDMHRFRECIDVIEGFDFSLDCYSTLCADFDHHIAMLACMFSIINHKKKRSPYDSHKVSAEPHRRIRAIS